MEEVPQHDRSRRPLDRRREGQVGVGLPAAGPEEAGEPPVVDGERVDDPGELADQGDVGVLVRLRERDVEADHLRPVAGQRVHERGDLRARPGPAPLRLEALLVDRRDHHGRRRLPGPAELDAEVVGLELDELEEGEADREQREDDEDRAERERRRVQRGPDPGAEPHRLEPPLPGPAREVRISGSARGPGRRKRRDAPADERARRTTASPRRSSPDRGGRSAYSSPQKYSILSTLHAYSVPAGG